jgi:CTP:molybdopterin cytidylyltransferase MocA
MAAGEGRRLRPITERWPKPLLPIDGRPVLEALLHELDFADRITVVVGYLGDQIRRFLSGWDVEIAEQPEALGSADAVRRALVAGARPPLLVSAADTVYAAGSPRRFADAFAASGAAAGMMPPLWALQDIAVPFLDGLPGPPYELLTAFQRLEERGEAVARFEAEPFRTITTPVDLVRHNFHYLED